MNTFLPLPSIIESVACLDSKRLGKQRVEAFQLLKAIKDPYYHWSRHPAAKMWIGYENALAQYYNACIDEWIKRSYNNSMEKKNIAGEIVMPPWFRDDRLHSSHRSNLLRKDFKYYSKFGWLEDSTMKYFWPI